MKGLKEIMREILPYLVVVLLFVSFVLFIGYSEHEEEIERYSVGCEVTQMAYAEESVSRSHSKPVYKMGVRNDDFATTLNVTGEQFAQFVVGDVVEVEVRVIEFTGGERIYEYKLLGEVIE
jgi:hypothetical protein